MSVSGEGNMVIAGIFIKHVLESSPAGRNGTLKTGDRILEVCSIPVRSCIKTKICNISYCFKPLHPCSYMEQEVGMVAIQHGIHTTCSNCWIQL